MATMGLFKIPFGFEVGQSDRDRLFLERATASARCFRANTTSAPA